MLELSILLTLTWDLPDNVTNFNINNKQYSIEKMKERRKQLLEEFLEFVCN